MKTKASMHTDLQSSPQRFHPDVSIETRIVDVWSAFRRLFTGVLPLHLLRCNAVCLLEMQNNNRRNPLPYTVGPVQTHVDPLSQSRI